MIRSSYVVRPLVVGALLATAACGSGDGAPDGASADAEATEVVAPATPKLVSLWSQGTPAFGVFVPSEGPARAEDGSRLAPVYTVDGGRALAENELLDYLFLNLEQGYDPQAIGAIAEGVAASGVDDPPTLLVRIPPISTDGADAARERVAEALAAGAGGVVLPHVRSPEEAAQAVSFFEEAGADVWSPANPDGTVIAFLMIEDEGALAAVQQIADTPGYSVLACGIGSLSRALGSREAGEAGSRTVLEHAVRAGLPDVITANADDVVGRIEEGYLGLLMGGPGADEAIRVGREAAGR